MIKDVAVISPHTRIVDIKDNFDCGFGWNQDGIPFCAGEKGRDQFFERVDLVRRIVVLTIENPWTRAMGRMASLRTMRHVELQLRGINGSGRDYSD
jgi:hypothetical protein